MTIRGGRRALLTLYLLLTALVFLAAFVGAVNALMGNPMRFDVNAFIQPVVLAAGGGMSVVAAAAGVFLLFQKREKREQTFPVLSSEIGQVLLSASAVDNMARRVVARHQEIKDVQTKIAQADGGLCVRIKGSIAGDVSVPELSREVQEDVREYVQTIGGLTVKEVLVFIDSVHAADLPRPVERTDE